MLRLIRSFSYLTIEKSVGMSAFQCVYFRWTLHHRHVLLWGHSPSVCAPQHPTHSQCFCNLLMMKGQMYNVVSSAKKFILSFI